VFGRSSLGSWNNASVFTFSSNYQGIFVLDLVGTTLVTVPLGGTCTRTTGQSIVNGAATDSTTYVVLSALAGQTLRVGTVGAAVTSAIARMGNYTVSLG